jgi:hypothetical protein
MPERLADVIVAALRVVNIMLNTWVDLGAPDPLTSSGHILVDNLAQVAVTMANTLALLLLNNPV